MNNIRQFGYEFENFTSQLQENFDELNNKINYLEYKADMSKEFIKELNELIIKYEGKI